MSERKYKFFLNDILKEIKNIEKFTSNIENLNDLEENELVLYAVLKALENIGEAVKHIPEDIKLKYPYHWKEISGLRNIIVHNYWGIDIEIIYDILENEIKDLKNFVEKILENEK
ncbi:MAG: DUF86 domain-containing protein [Aquificota bacterium]|nr:MAG: DUF86 domain-containing protein [Aquificota bacterium]